MLTRENIPERGFRLSSSRRFGVDAGLGHETPDEEDQNRRHDADREEDAPAETFRKKARDDGKQGDRYGISQRVAALNGSGDTAAQLRAHDLADQDAANGRFSPIPQALEQSDHHQLPEAVCE